MASLTMQTSFTSGELSPYLSARVDLAKYGQGCRTLKNFKVQPHGGAVKRPGFLLLDDLPGEAVLKSFVFNKDQAYCLAFGQNWLRVFTADGPVLSGGYVYQIATPYTLAQARDMSLAQSADVIFIACWGVAPTRLKRLAHANWQFETISFDPPISPPTWISGQQITTQNYSKAFRAYDGSFSFVPIAFQGVNDGNDNIIYEPITYDLYRQSSTTTTLSGVSFVHGAHNSDGSDSPAQLITPYSYHITAIDATGRESEISAPGSITGPSNNNWQGGDYIQLFWNAVSGAVEYRVYKSEYGGRLGYMGTTSATSFQDHNVAPAFSESPPKYNNPFPNGDYPGLVAIFEQRLVFASSPNRPQTIWMSKTGDYTNFADYTPLADDSPLELTLASSEVSSFCWMAVLRSLVLGSTSMEWEISSSQGAFTAKSARATKQSEVGSTKIPSIIVGNTILHVARNGSQTRDLKYDFGADSYGGSDTSIMASHLFERYRVTSWTYQQFPDSVVWCVREDGGLMGMTYMPEHEVYAWHRHETRGLFKSVCSVPNGQEDVLYAVIQRQGQYYMERLAPRYIDGDFSASVFLDQALVYNQPGTMVSTLSGLTHLEGQTVSLLSRGAVERPRKVVGGQIALDRPSDRVIVGLSYVSDLETMPVELIGQGGTSVGRKKVINSVNILFYATSLALIGPSFDRLEEAKWRTDELFGQPPRAFYGLKNMVLPNLAENQATVCVRSDRPTPMTILSIMPEISVN